MNENTSANETVQQETPSSKRELKKAERQARREAKRARKAAGAADNRRRLSVLCGICVAVTIGAVGFSGIQYTQASAMMEEIDAATATAIVPTQDLPAGTILTSANTKKARVPKTYLPRTAAKSAKDIEGLKCITNMTAGVPIDLSAVSGSASPAGIGVAVRDGFVAKMLAMDAAPGMSPLLSPGDYVTVSGVDANGEVVSFQGVRVIALDGSFDLAAGTAYSTVTIELTQEQADALLGLSVSLAAEPVGEHLGDIVTADEAAAAPEGAEKNA